MKSSFKRLLPPLLPLIVWVIVMEFLNRNGVVQSYIIPAPSDVIFSLWNDRFEFLNAAAETSRNALIGLLLSALIGVSVSILLSLSTLAKQAFLPYALFFQTVPIIAIAPILVIWFGFGSPTVVASAFIVSIFPIVASTLVGLESTEPALVDLFRIYKATPLQSLVRLRLPFAMPYIFSGFKISAGLAVIGALVGEFVGGGGIGAVIDSAKTQQRLDKVFAAVFISALIGFFMFAMTQGLSSYVLKNWHPSERT